MQAEGGPTDQVHDPFPALRAELLREYGNTVSEEAIDRIAHHSVGRLERARVREFVPLLARRHAQAHLRRRTR